MRSSVNWTNSNARGFPVVESTHRISGSFVAAERLSTVPETMLSWQRSTNLKNTRRSRAAFVSSVDNRLLFSELKCRHWARVRCVETIGGGGPAENPYWLA
jgi:hypothetical protein